MSNEIQIHNMDAKAVELVKTTIMPGASDMELEFFLAVCKRTGLDPITRQIHAIKRGSGDRAKWVVQIAIDGFRLQAQRSDEYEGQTPVEWYDGATERWVNVWNSDDTPVAARVGVYRKGFREPLYKIAHYDEYVQLKEVWENNKRTGVFEPNEIWKTKVAGQLAKCAEALALRAGFPAELSGLYTDDEMGQADNPEHARAGRTNAKATVMMSEEQRAQLEDFLHVDELTAEQKEKLAGTLKEGMSWDRAGRMIHALTDVVKKVRESGGSNAKDQA